MIISTSQLPLSLPEHRSAMPAARAPLVPAMAAPAPRGPDREVLSAPTTVVGDLQQLGRYSPANRGGLLLYAVTGGDVGPAAGARVDVRI